VIQLQLKSNSTEVAAANVNVMQSLSLSTDPLKLPGTPLYRTSSTLIAVTIAFNEPVVGFSASDVVITNGLIQVGGARATFICIFSVQVFL
jgi:hypothetical protein